MRQDQTDRLTASIVEFSTFLRTREVSAHPGQTITALEAVKTIDPANRQSFASALQAALCSTHEEWERFPELFPGILGRIASPAAIGLGRTQGTI